MTVEIGPWFKMPNNIFRSGTAAKLGKMETLLYAALCEFANGEGENTFRASDKQLASVTGIGTRTICDARKKLLEEHLIECLPRPKGQTFTYKLCPVSLRFMRLEERVRRKDRPRALHGRSTSAISAEPQAARIA